MYKITVTLDDGTEYVKMVSASTLHDAFRIVFMASNVNKAQCGPHTAYKN